jgi:branched-subunit amino acid ABC-type transport system permease component
VGAGPGPSPTPPGRPDQGEGRPINLLWESVGFGLVTAAVVATGAVGLTLQVGVTNFVNFAYGDFATFGAYVAYALDAAGVGFVPAVIGGGLATGLLALLCNLVIFRAFVSQRARVITLVIVTLGLSLILQDAVIVIWGTSAYKYSVTIGNALRLGPFVMTPGDLAIIGGSALLLVLLHLLLQHTRFGKSLRATSDNAELALACGIDTERLVNWTWAISGFFAAVAGVALVLETNTLRPTLGFNELFLFFAAVILGGMGRPYGAMLGALIIGLATEVSGMFVDAAYKTAIAFAILVIVLLFRPEGIFAVKGKTS